MCRKTSKKDLEQKVLVLEQAAAEARRLQEALRQSEENYRILVENATDIIYRTDASGCFVFFNAAAVRLTRYAEADLIGKHYTELLRTDYREEAQRFYGLQFVKKISRTYLELPLITKEKKELWVGQHVQLIIEDDRVLGFYAIARDITGRQLAEEALKASEEKYRKIFEGATEGIFQATPEGKYLNMNPAFAKMFGFASPREMIETITDINRQIYVNPDERNEILQKLRELGKVDGYEVEVYRKDGSRFWISVNIHTVCNDAGNILYVEGTNADITERKKAEAALQESEEKYRSNEQFLRLITDNVQDAIRLMDLQTLKYTYANPYCEQLFGIPPEDYIHAELGSNLDEDEKIRLFKIFQDELEHDYERDPRRYRFFSLREKHGVTKDIIWTENKASFIRDASGKPTAIISITRDITEQKRMEEERERLQERLGRSEKMEAVGTLAGGVAHDLNNVLGVLVGYSELMLEKIPEGSPLKKYAANILNSSQRGSAIIQDLLTLARRGVTIAEVVNLNYTVQNYLRTPEFESVKGYHPQVTFKIELAKDLLHIKGSPVHLGKTIMNVISNAAEAISGEGKVTVRTENRYLDHPIRGYDDIREGDYVVLTVADNGQGISPQDIDKIFEPFYTKKVMGRSGTGLGLAVVWGTVKDHSGYIDVQSEEGIGTTFTLYFPATREEPEETVKAIPPDHYMSKGESILVVDDVREQRELAINILERLGYQVEAVSGGEAAVDYIQKKKPDLVVLDMIMDPGIDGMETYRRILEINPGQKAIIVSGFSETDKVRKAQEMGAGTFVRKPYMMEKIGLAIRRELDRK